MKALFGLIVLLATGLVLSVACTSTPVPTPTPTPTTVPTIQATPIATPIATPKASPTVQPVAPAEQSQPPTATPVPAPTATATVEAGLLWGSFRASVSSLERKGAKILVSIVLTKIANGRNVAGAIPVYLTDDHGNIYAGAANFPIDRGKISLLPIGFSFAVEAQLAVPEAAPIQLIQIGNAVSGQAIASPDSVKTFQEQLGSGTKKLKPGSQSRVAKYVVVTPGAVSGGLGWYIPLVLANEDYNPVGMKVEAISQDVNGYLIHEQSLDVALDGLKSKTVNLHFKTVSKLVLLYIEPSSFLEATVIFLSQPDEFPPAVGVNPLANSPALDRAAHAIADAYGNANGETALGAPQQFVRFINGGVAPANDSDAAIQIFPNASGGEAAIVAAQKGSAFVIAGATWKKYLGLGTLKSSLGVPVSNAAENVSSFNTKGRIQQFSGGFIVELASGGHAGAAYALTAPVAEIWKSLSQSSGPLGFPVGNLSVSPPSGASHMQGSFQKFEGGSVFSAGQAYAVYGEAEKKYWELGGPASLLGFPIGEVNSVFGGKFEAGFAFRSAGTAGIQFFPPIPPKWQMKFAQSIDSMKMSEDAGTLYFFTNGTLFAANAKTGDTIWKFSTSLPTDRPQWVIAADMVIVGRLANSSVAGLDRATGKVIWQQFVDTAESWLAWAGQNVFALDSKKGKLWALDLKSGAVKWTVSAADGIFPNARDGTIFVATGRGKLLGGAVIGISAFAAADGKLLWHNEQDFTPPLGSNQTYPVWGIGVDDNSVYEFSQPRGDVTAYSYGGKLQWKFKFSGDFDGGEENCGKNICIFTGSGVYSLQKTTGLAEWQYRDASTYEPVNDSYSFSSGSALWLTTLDGILGLNTENGNLIALVPVPIRTLVAGSKDTLYLATSGYLAAFDIAAIIQAKTAAAQTKESRKVIFIDAINSSSSNECNDPSKTGLIDPDGANRVEWIVDYLAADENVRSKAPLDKDRDFLYFSYADSYCGKSDNSPDYRMPKYQASDTCGGVANAAMNLNKLIGSLDPSMKIDLIGHSMGGLVVAEWIWAHPKMQSRVNSVVTFDSPLRGVPDKVPIGVSAAVGNKCDTSSSLSWNDLWCQEYAVREKCASDIVPEIAKLGDKIPFFTMDATQEDFPKIEEVPGDRTTLLASNSRLHCKFDDNHDSLWTREKTGGGPVNCWNNFSYPERPVLDNYPSLPGDISVGSPSPRAKEIFVSCAVAQLDAESCRSKLMQG